MGGGTIAKEGLHTEDTKSNMVKKINLIKLLCVFEH
jgi:hypothetical protein